MDPKLLDLLVCPITKAPLQYDRAAQELVAVESGLAFPVKDGIPVMLEDEARKLSETELADWRKRRPPAP
ncbi:MAG: Trm112 family protein [Burkholderiales bacterium]